MDPDYADRIVRHFLQRAGRNTATSGKDQHLILRWQQAGVPVALVLQGIDQAFAARREPPTCLAECSRWITRAAKPAAPAVSPPPAPPAADTPLPDHPVVRHLDALVRQHPAMEVRGAARSLLREVLHLQRPDHTWPADLWPALPAALTGEILARMATPERHALGWPDPTTLPPHALGRWTGAVRTHYGLTPLPPPCEGGGVPPAPATP